MSRNLVIDVNVNPNSQPKPTEARVTTTNEALDANNKKRNNDIEAAVALSVIRRGISIATANIGELTGNRTAQRKVQGFTTMATYGIAAIDNPLAAGLTLALQIGTNAIERALENRNVQNEVEYNRVLRTATYNNGRK